MATIALLFIHPVLFNRVAAAICMSQSFASFFTVYETKDAIELHPGCRDIQDVRVICSCLSYESACTIAQLSANLKQLPVLDYVVSGALSSDNPSTVS